MKFEAKKIKNKYTMNKNIFLSFVAVLAFGMVSAFEPETDMYRVEVSSNDASEWVTDNVSDTYGPSITFEKTKHNFGNIKQGVPVSYEFKFTNNGNANLIVKEATAGCGCTTPVWPKEPIAPGKTGVIKVGYDAKRDGSFVKDIKVSTNGGDIKLTITGTVELQASEPEQPSLEIPMKRN
jgi:hypothetical protein